MGKGPGCYDDTWGRSLAYKHRPCDGESGLLPGRVARRDLGTGADLGGYLRPCRDRGAGDAIDAGVGMVKMRDFRMSHGSCSPDAFGDLQVPARGTYS